MPTDATLTSIFATRLAELKKSWRRIVLLGALLVVLGIFALTSSVLMTVASVQFLGALLILGGLLQLGGHFMDVVMGLINLTAGFMILSNPGAAAVGLTLIIAYFLILGGALRIAMAISIRLHQGIWIGVHGAMGLLLGVLIMVQWPLSGLWVIGLFIGIDMIFNGLSWILLGLAVKRLPLESITPLT